MGACGRAFIMCFKFGEILLPKDADVSTWAVVACDQYTSNPAYWKEIESKVEGKESTLNLVFPEVFLGQNDDERIAKIVATQKEYVESGVLEKIDGTVLVKRKTAFGNERLGLMCLVDLDEYTCDKGTKPLIRATEGLVESRIPPRAKIRKDCLMELPHVMVLIDDENRTVIEPLMTNNDGVLYDGELNGNGGRITGYQVKNTAQVEIALKTLLEKFTEKYGEKLLFLVGDGNHSLATAKACVKEDNPLSKYALVEIVNIYDEGLKFEPIHRVLFDINNTKFVEELRKIMASESGKTTVFVGDKAIEIPFPENSIEGVKKTQAFIDEYLKENEGEVDYIHGSKDLTDLCASRNAVGILLGAIDKSTFFEYVVKNGTLPRKTFSMGEADEKRYYMEARMIK